MRRRLPWILLPLGLLGLDALSKLWVLRHLSPGQSLTVIPDFFSLSLGFNTGAIFGFLAGQPSLWRTILFIAATVALLLYFGYAFLGEAMRRSQRIALGLILGGAAGNAMDRLVHGAVVDFLDFSFGGWHYWAFNVADSCIVSGVILYALTVLFQKKTAQEG